MFTGLVEAVAKVTDVRFAGGGARVAIEVTWPEPDAETRLGDSVAVNGACLTVIARTAVPGGEALAFDLSHETLALTHFAGVQIGDPCNVERALRMGDRLGGPLVTGHVDAVGHLVSRTEHPAGWDLRYRLPTALLPEIVLKGSICLDGVSLTVNGIGSAGDDPDILAVTIVPHTSLHTQLLHGPVGKPVHVETDVLAKHVRRLLSFSGTVSAAAVVGQTAV